VYRVDVTGLIRVVAIADRPHQRIGARKIPSDSNAARWRKASRLSKYSRTIL